jgi:hypothetical protein
MSGSVVWILRRNHSDLMMSDTLKESSELGGVRQGGRARVVMAAPAILIGVGWVALWLLWPSAPTAKPRMRTTGSVRFVGEIPVRSQSYFEHTGFGFPSRIGFGVMDQPSAEESVRIPANLSGVPRFLEREPVSAGSPTGTVHENLDAKPDRQSLVYRPGWNEAPVFKAQVGVAPALCVRLSRALKERGFVPPTLSTNQLPAARDAWQVVLVVEVGNEGRPEHVFVESGCESPEINATIARLMYGGSVPEGRPCSGRVWVWLGAP